MNFELPFDFNTRTWWINQKANGPGPAIAEIRQSDTPIKSFRADASGKIYVSDGDGQFDELNTSYACLTRDKALDCLREKYDNGGQRTVLLNPEKKTRGILFLGGGNYRILDEAFTMDFLEGCVSTGFAAGEPDEDGHFALYDPSAWDADTIPTSFIRDAHGNPVTAMYGPFLLLRCIRSETPGLLELADIDPGITAPAPGDPGTDLAYDPSYWKECRDLTVGAFARLLLDAYPENARICCCGADPVFLHCAPKAGIVSIDCDPMEHLDEYENHAPERIAGKK